MIYIEIDMHELIEANEDLERLINAEQIKNADPVSKFNLNLEDEIKLRKNLESRFSRQIKNEVRITEDLKAKIENLAKENSSIRRDNNIFIDKHLIMMKFIRKILKLKDLEIQIKTLEANLIKMVKYIK